MSASPQGRETCRIAMRIEPRWAACLVAVVLLGTSEIGAQTKYLSGQKADLAGLPPDLAASKTATKPPPLQTSRRRPAVGHDDVEGDATDPMLLPVARSRSPARFASTPLNEFGAHVQIARSRPERHGVPLARA